MGFFGWVFWGFFGWVFWVGFLMPTLLWRDFDQGHLHPQLEITGLTCPGRESNPGLRGGRRALIHLHETCRIILSCIEDGEMEHIATPKVENVFLLDNLNPRNSTGSSFLPSLFLFQCIHRLNMELDLQNLFGLHVTWCTQLYSFAEAPQPPSPRIWTRIYEGAIGQSR